MRYRIIILILLFYFLILLQNSFFAQMAIYGAVPNLALILACLVSFFFSQKTRKSDRDEYNKYAAISLVAAAGIMVDIFSQSFFGVSILSFLIIYFFMRKSLDLLLDMPKKYQIFYFLPMFLVSLFIYNAVASGSSYLSGSPNFYFFSDLNFFLATAVYNLVLSAIGFYLFLPINNGSQKI